ncbi:MAG: hypothetical protein ACJA0Q_001878 [Saprospiraceae bacterium]
MLKQTLRMSENDKKYQVNITSSKGKATDGSSNKVDPSKYKDFDKVYKSYSDVVYNKPWYKFQFQKAKNRKTTLYIMVILVVAALVIMEYLKD